MPRTARMTGSQRRRHAPSREGRRHDSWLAGGHSGLAEVPYRCATAPDFHRTFPVAAGYDSRPREHMIELWCDDTRKQATRQE